MKKNTGFSFVEIMVCVAILSAGLLGLLGLQARSLKSNVSANQKTQATLLAYNIIDRMRANTAESVKFTTASKALVKSNDPTTNTKLVTDSLYVTTVVSDSTVPDANCQPASVTGTPVATCTSAKMAVNDLVQWNRDLTALFCGGNGTTNIVCNGSALGKITYTAPTASEPYFFTLTVTISWDDNRNDIVDNRDSIDPTQPCYPNTALPTLGTTPVQFDPCFRTDFKLAVPNPLL